MKKISRDEDVIGIAVLLYFVFVSSFLAHRVVSCLGNLICNSPRDNLIGVLSLSLRACSHEPGTVNYPGVMIAPGQALPRVHMIICCPGATLPRVNFIAPG